MYVRNREEGKEQLRETDCDERAKSNIYTRRGSRMRKEVCRDEGDRACRQRERRLLPPLCLDIFLHVYIVPCWR